VTEHATGHRLEQFATATSASADWPVADLVATKGAHRVAVVIPARNEAGTIASIVAAVRHDLVSQAPLVDDVIVIDSDSTDDTAAVAQRAGARVHAVATIRPDLGHYPGKGEALWKSQFVTSADILVFVDADLTEWGTHFVTGLLGPMLADPGVLLVKGFYDRILNDGSGGPRLQGGRVTELVARPLLSLYWPPLREIVQPLAGEWAIRRATFAGLPVPIGYGVEMSTLLDVYREHGKPALAQVDLGARDHFHQSVHDLGVMAGEIIAVAMRRLGQQLPDEAELRQFDRGTRTATRTRPIPLVERPPGSTVGQDPDGRP
jgi:glucosyl-3-phosphoglycerate synthase